MRIINICVDDYANLSYDNCQALKSVGIDCASYKLVKHPFGYENQSDVITMREMAIKIKSADIIQITHSSLTLLQECIRAKKTRVIMYHTGTTYRNSNLQYNSVCNDYLELTMTDQCEFMGLGARNIHYITTAIDVKKYPKFEHQIKLPYKVAHYPSNELVKGTAEIKYFMEIVSQRTNNLNFTCDTTILKQKDNYKRMGLCDIYVELYKPSLKGKPYGCYGVTAFEAAAMGKIVVTQNLNPKVYENTYGETKLLYANNNTQFLEIMERLANMSEQEISTLQTETYLWVCKNHSYQAIGNQLKSLLKL